jgi:hypothetical protein
VERRLALSAVQDGCVLRVFVDTGVLLSAFISPDGASGST